MTTADERVERAGPDSNRRAVCPHMGPTITVPSKDLICFRNKRHAGIE